MLEGLEISEVKLSQLEYSGRLDSEYYRPECLKLEHLLRGRSSTRLGEIANFLIGPFGSAFSVENYTDDRTYRYIRGKDVKPMRLMDDDNVYMPVSDFDRLSKYALKKGDILISVVGTTGNAAIVRQDDLPAIFSCKSTVIRVRGIDPHYLLTYLNTKFGQLLLKRKERGAVQMGLNLDDLKTLDVYDAGSEFQEAVADVYKKSVSIEKSSKKVFAEAESLMLDILGLNNYLPECKSVNIKSFKDSFVGTGRLDAEYYQPKYENLLKLLRKDGLTIADVAPVRNERFQGTLSADFQYLEIGGLTGDGRVASETVACADAPSRASQRVRQGDIITSTVRPIRRLSALVAPAQDGYVCSSGFVVLEPKQIAAEVLLVYLRLHAICELMDLHTSASLYPAISEKDLSALPIPNIPDDVQRKIAALAQQSFTLKAQSERLLEAAKRAVEIAIEQDEAAGMAYLAREGALA